MIIRGPRDGETWGHWAQRQVAFVAQFALGRRRIAAWGDVLSGAAALDPPDLMGDNGELLVQEVAIYDAPPGPVTIFDVGAHRGRWALPLLERAKWLRREGVTVHAFEPAARDFAGLREVLTEYDDGERLVLRRLGMGHAPGTAVLHPSRVDGAASVLGVAQPGGPPEEIELVSFDEYCRQQGIEQVRLLKVDVEGQDFHVLEGATGMLERRAVDLVQFEYEARWIHARAYLKDVFDLLQPLGYRIGKLTSRGVEFYSHWDVALETFRQGNYLACLEDQVGDFRPVSWWRDGLPSRDQGAGT